MLFGTIYIPDEKGELTALNETVESALSQVPQTDYAAAIAKMLFSLIILVTLLFTSLWFIRRLMQQRLRKGNEDQSIQILEKRMISPKTILYLIEVERKKILISESQLEVRQMASFDLPVPDREFPLLADEDR